MEVQASVFHHIPKLMEIFAFAERQKMRHLNSPWVPAATIMSAHCVRFCLFVRVFFLFCFFQAESLQTGTIILPPLALLYANKLNQK